MKFTPFFLFAILTFFSCNSTPEPTHKVPVEEPEVIADTISKTVNPIPKAKRPSYLLSKPDNSSRLSSKLTEISGLSLSPDGKSLLAVNDEQGKLFYLDKKDGEIIRTVKFGKGADYEGVETVGEQVYVVESNGTLHKIKDLQKDDPDTKKYDTPLNSKYDVEGLAYDPNKNWLLLACKGKAGNGPEYKGSRAIYAFDIESKELIEKPVFLVNRDAIGDYFATDDISEKLVNLLGPEYATNAFAPSGIAIHPKTSDICIVSSVGKLFIILSPTGKILHMEKLESSIFKQPEGICFDKNGTLYISTEGKGGKAKLYQFLQN